MMCSRLSRLVLGASVCAASMAIQFAFAAWLEPAHAQAHSPQTQGRGGETDAMRRAGELARDANRHFDTLMPKVTGSETAPSRIAQAQPQAAVKPVGTTSSISQLSPLWSWLETSNREYQRVIVKTLSSGGPASQSIASQRGERPAAPVGAPVPDPGRAKPQPRAPGESAPAVVAEQRSVQPTPPEPRATQPSGQPSGDAGTFEQMQVAVQKWFSRANREYNSQIVKRLADQGGGPAAPAERDRAPTTVAAVPATAPKRDDGRADSARQLAEAAKKAELQRREEQGRRMIELAQQKAQSEAAARQSEQQQKAAEARKAAEAKQAAEVAARAKAEQAERAAQEKQRQQQAAELARREQERKEADAAAQRLRAEESRRAALVAAEQKREAALREAEARKREAARQAEQRRLADEKRKTEEAARIAAARAEAERKRAATREQEAARLARLQIAEERRAIERAREQRIAREAKEEEDRLAAERRLMEAARRAEQDRQAAALRQRTETPKPAPLAAASKTTAEPVAKADSAQKRGSEEGAKRLAATGKAVGRSTGKSVDKSVGKAVVAKRSSRSRRADRRRAAERKRTVVNIVSAAPAQAPSPTVAAGVPDSKLKVVRRASSRSKPRASALKGRTTVRKRSASPRKASRRPVKSYGYRGSRSGLGAKQERTKKSKGRPASKPGYKYRSRKKRNSCRHDAGLKVVPGQHYVVKAGDSLRGIAERHYNDGGKFQLLLRANRSVIRDPDNMQPCLKLIIPHAA